LFFITATQMGTLDWMTRTRSSTIFFWDLDR